MSLLSLRACLRGRSQFLQIGSHGECQYKYLKYYNPQSQLPLAVFHVTYFGPGKDWLKLLVQRLSFSAGPEQQPPILGIQGPGPAVAKAVIVNRLAHAVLRTQPACGVVNFTQHLSAMIIHETQLMYESITPYLFHDAVALGAPVDLVYMWCASIFLELTIISLLSFLLCRIFLQRLRMQVPLEEDVMHVCFVPYASNTQMSEHSMLALGYTSMHRICHSLLPSI